MLGLSKNLKKKILNQYKPDSKWDEYVQRRLSEDAKTKLVITLPTSEEKQRILKKHQKENQKSQDQFQTQSQSIQSVK